MQFINLTPHRISLVTEDNQIVNIEPSGSILRIPTEETEIGKIHHIKVISSRFGELSDLPAPQEGVAYLVPTMVLNHPSVKGRKDIFAPATSPNHVIRDTSGRITAVKALVIAPTDCGFWALRAENESKKRMGRTNEECKAILVALAQEATCLQMRETFSFETTKSIRAAIRTAHENALQTDYAQDGKNAKTHYWITALASLESIADESDDPSLRNWLNAFWPVEVMR